jgi:cystathionine gamma-lyase
MIDIATVAEAANESGARLVIDNTVATPLGQAPMEFGAHGSLMSGSKNLTGHNDLLLGSFTTRDDEWYQRLRKWRTEWGTIVGPFETWLAHRSLATLSVRVERQCANALALARVLAERGEIKLVRYPGLPDDPGHDLGMI